ncbi:glycosyltransferase family 4 protein [Sulfurimonas sp. HSL-1656]|uniref:glycosyltransferase family 4 protein n=1 Tax=Thiomicrolovo subterrani TaxID=3131934 RepID=UPI0031F7C2AD
MKKLNLLCILHLSPPTHGAAKVGDFIHESSLLKDTFECRFIPIRSSETIGEIGKVNVKKFWYFVELFFKVLWSLIVFRPEKIYFTASVKGFAFYRDLLLSPLWKVYSAMTKCEIFYHYHTKGVDAFVSDSTRNLQLTRFFLKGVNLILLSPLLEKDFEHVATYKGVAFLPNGVEDLAEPKGFETLLQHKYASIDEVQLLYLSNMIKEKGYVEVLKLADVTKGEKIHFHFAGGWQNDEDEKEFFEFINEKGLQERVTFHGFMKGDDKAFLLQNAHLLLFPTRYKAETFGLVIIEAMSFGVPTISTDEGSIPNILDEKCGIVLHDNAELYNSLQIAKQKLLNPETARYCRQRYLENFTLEKFEHNLIGILQGEK